MDAVRYRIAGAADVATTDAANGGHLFLFSHIASRTHAAALRPLRLRNRIVSGSSRSAQKIILSILVGLAMIQQL
jgi:hypothetical protein